VIILFLLLEPYGLFGIWIRIKRYWKTWPYTY
jgi:branched-chain amino acid transport system permease protein